MAITRWDPFRDLVALQESMNRLFDESLRSRAGDQEISFAAWSPAVDIYESESALVIKAELPEVDRKDIDIKVENNVLTIRGERKLQKEIREENYFRMERQYGTFSRSFSLPSNVDPSKVDASYKVGVLTIELAKLAESEPHQIEIK